jgi:hypothetical protein
MKKTLLYVELKDGHSGPAWIGYGQFSKTGRTVYFNGSILQKGQGISGNHFDIETGDEYWVSGVKKDGTDRLYGSGIISIDRSAVEEYLTLTGLSALPKNKFSIIDLNNTPEIEWVYKIKNQPLYE